ncbi:hypothetical protein [Hydrogenimonas cancrithermarum]|uniref:Uncharacterized protein n=1 Tax=Hydrogenimonas cancrithermarum TaxID=2993563 RepID=A0ABM8FJB9_9BACT|nr:hypothetical protein [Hydrogenimonas cancrithermarum]BDY11717.1 hypothetical protein HCR_00290 [Hydrogenimonas cancrithermarum]
MKRIALFFLLTTLLFGFDPARYKAKIVENIALILLHRQEVWIFTDDPSFKSIFKYDPKLKKASSCSKAEFILSRRLEVHRKVFEQNSSSQFFFATSYRDYLKNKDVAIGAFFWQKGRPTLLFNKKLLQRHNISLPEKYRKYIE